MQDYVAALLAPRDRNKTLTALAEPVGIVAATTARARAKGIAFRVLVADCFYRPSESPHFIAELDRAATP